MGELYTNESWFQAAFITLVLGGGGAWLAGRAVAATWRSRWAAVAAAVLMAMAVRFVHFALFEETLLAGRPFALETLALVAISALAFQRTRALQMVRQYYWLYEQRGPLGWRARHDAPQRPN